MRIGMRGSGLMGGQLRLALRLCAPLLLTMPAVYSLASFSTFTAQRGDRQRNDLLTVFVGGDVMIGRGIDQLLPHPSDPRLREPYVRDARTYVDLAEARSGRIPRPLSLSYIWGDALKELERVAPDVRIINLETSVTRSDDYWKSKEIHYRMHPDNVPCLTAARINVCSLANNHTMDYGYIGLVDTLNVLKKAGIGIAGAGRSAEEAQQPAVIDLPGNRRVIVFGFATGSSGIPQGWAANETQAGVAYLSDLSARTASVVLERIKRVQQAGQVVVVSIHWGSNWGYDVPPEHVRFAHQLIDGGVDIIHAHSSHHPRPIEVYRGKLILYGCGDLLNDYEGIRGYEEFRGDLALMYFATVASGTGELVDLRMTPMQIRKFALNRASSGDTEWLAHTLTRISRQFGSRIEVAADATLVLRLGSR